MDQVRVYESELLRDVPITDGVLRELDKIMEESTHVLPDESRFVIGKGVRVNKFEG